MSDTTKKRIFSGMQPSGEAHLGNYLGALRPWVALQDEYHCVWCIVDDHAITAGGRPQDMPGHVFDLAVSFLAVGLDPERAIIFVQSDVHEHTELAWLFVTAILATAGHYTFTRAMAAVELTVLQPFSFLQLVWAALAGYYLFAEVPDVWTLTGGAIIVASVTYIAHREALATRMRSD